MRKSALSVIQALAHTLLNALCRSCRILKQDLLHAKALDTPALTGQKLRPLIAADTIASKCCCTGEHAKSGAVSY